MITAVLPAGMCLETLPQTAPEEVAPPMCVQDDCRLFGALLNETPQGILVVDEQGVIVFANLAISVLFLPHPLAVGEKIADSRGLAFVAGLVEDVRCQRSRVEGDLRFTVPQAKEWGGERHYHASAAPWTEGGRAGVWVMVEDVTERIMTEQVRQDFVTNAGHELRTPLSLIHGYIETLKSGLIKNAGALQRCMNVMEKHSRRMMRIIEDMLTISRLEGRDELLKMDAFFLRGCVDNALEHLLVLIETRQPVITLHFPPDGGLLHGDRFYWDQILTNLIENALKKNPHTGLRLTITGRWSPHECILTIEDDGVGILAEDVPFVFKRFYRCAKDHSQEVKGTGLGLSIVKRAVEAHGGSIELESHPNVRTVFTIRVPLPG